MFSIDFGRRVGSSKKILRCCISFEARRAESEPQQSPESEDSAGGGEIAFLTPFSSSLE